MRLKFLFLFVFFAFFALLVSCSEAEPGNEEPETSSSSHGSPNANISSSSSSNVNVSSSSSSNANISSSSSSNANSSSSSGTTDNPSRDDLGKENAIIIKYNGNSAPTIDNPYENEVTINATSANVVVNSTATSTEYNFIVSGTTTAGSLRIYGEYKIGLHLNGASITNPNGSAINIQNGKQILVNLVQGKSNSLSGKAVYGEAEDAKGAFFSEGQLIFSGEGSLNVASSLGHAIVTDDYFEIESGTITITGSDNDGIHANDDITIKGGNINITCKGDAIQSERENSAVRVSGGKVKAKTTDVKSHGISSEGETKISGNAEVELEVNGNGSKGIKAGGLVTIEGGTIKIKTTGTTYTAGEDEENKTTGIKTDGSMKISGGDITIESTGADSKGIKTNENLDITSGKVRIVARSHAVKTDGNLKISGGTVYLESKEKKAIDSKSKSITTSIQELDKSGGLF
jgi:hypothetical protein